MEEEEEEEKGAKGEKREIRYITIWMVDCINPFGTTNTHTSKNDVKSYEQLPQ